MARWCPNCRAEYIEGWDTCSNCGVELVATPPAEPKPTTDLQPRPQRDHDDPFVPVWEGPTIEADHMRLRIEAQHIPVDLDEALQSGHSRVVVPRSYLEEVRDVLAGRVASWPPEVTAQTSDGFDWSPGIRLALVVVAIVLVLVLLFA